MKLCIFCVLVSFAGTYASGVYSQNTGFSLNAENETLRTILGKIESQSDFVFLYSEKVIDVERQLSLKMENVPLEMLLDKLFGGTSVTYTQKGRQIVLTTSALSSGHATQQTGVVTVSGIVIDSGGEPLYGVSVAVLGEGRGTVTNSDGRYSLSAVSVDAVLVFSFVGMLEQEVPVKGRTTIDVTMQESYINIEEVIAVGFQTQKKVNLTGAVASVSAEALENRPVLNVGQALQGVVPNLNVNISSGAPNTVPSFNIRGGTTLVYDTSNSRYAVSNGSPLILIDGAEATATVLNQMNPNDIESISIIKDASASAIYGTRATYGVMLVQTRSGKFNQKSRINYSYDILLDKPSHIPDILDSYTLFNSILERTEWTDGTVNESQRARLEAFKAYQEMPVTENQWYMEGNAVIWVANVNPYKESVKNWSATQRHNLSISGGGENVSYYFSFGYMGQNGMYNIQTDKYNRYNGMIGLNAKISDWFKLGAKVAYSEVRYLAPYLSSGKGSLWSAMKGGEYEKNIFMPISAISPDGEKVWTDNILSWLSYGANTDSRRTTTNLNVSPEITLIPELKLKADFTYRPSNYRIHRKIPKHQYVTNNWNSLVSEQVEGSDNRVYMQKLEDGDYTLNIYADFHKTFADRHTISSIVGFNQEEHTNSTLSTTLQGLFSVEVPKPAAAEDQTLHTNTYTAWEIANRGAFGRITYNYNDRYLFEANGRYDGSSQLTKNNRYQFFPSFSAGWRVSEEAFMQGTANWLNNLKIRGSWGKLGNQPPKNSSNAYPYQAVMTSSAAGYLINGKYVSKVEVPALVSSSLTWEKATTWDIGIDILMFNNRLDFVFDYYERKTIDILTDGTASYPAVLGATPPYENSGEMKSYGWELSLKWSNRMQSGLSYDVGVVLSDYQNQVLYYAGNPNKSLDGKLYSGMKTGEIRGYTTGGILQEEDLVREGSKWVFNGPYQHRITTNLYPGYLWYRDINGDGKVDSGENTLENPGDRRVLGNNTPRYKFGVNMNVAYKGFDLNLLFNGIAKRDLWIGNSSYWGGNNAGSQWMYQRSWRPDRTDSRFPMYGAPVQTQTAYLINGAYLRLKQAVLGYSLPSHLVQRIGLEKVRINLAGYNLFEITDIPRAFDPDQISDNYPQKRTVVFGIQVGI